MTTRRPRMGGDVCAIFVHAGAGFHDLENERVTLQACEDAAQDAMAYLNKGGDAVKAVELAIKSFEDNPITNAGFGSNLSIDGVVECDATIVDHYGRSGAVGAVRQVCNPISLARLVLENYKNPTELYQVPNLLVGPGAVKFAHQSDIPVVRDEQLISTAARDHWLLIKAKLQKQALSETSVSATGQGDGTPSIFCEEEARGDIVEGEGDEVEGGQRQMGKAIEDEEVSEGEVEGGNRLIAENRWGIPGGVSLTGFNEERVSDTVGAIAIDCLGNIAAGSSSGGGPMKHQGRVGPAALVGIGTAVVPINPRDAQKACAAAVLSGTGEQMASTFAANTCARRVLSSTDPGFTDSVCAFIEEDFLNHPSLRHSYTTGLMGLLAVKKTVDGVWFYFGHNTKDFAFASMATGDTNPEAVMSRRSRCEPYEVTSGGRSFKHSPSPWSNRVDETWLCNPDNALNPPGQWA